jgi:hypothetical protein
MVEGMCKLRFKFRFRSLCGTAESGLHSNMGNIHRQRKTVAGNDIYSSGGSNG